MQTSEIAKISAAGTGPAIATIALLEIPIGIDSRLVGGRKTFVAPLNDVEHLRNRSDFITQSRRTFFLEAGCFTDMLGNDTQGYWA